MANEVFKGNDELYQKHMDQIEDMFKQSRDMQKERELVLKQSAENAQKLRDQQLKNMYLMEQIDE